MTRVLYVGGTGRSGSTVLSTVLGEVPGLVAVGEVRYLWDRGVQQDRLCGCGASFATCPFWTQVLETAFGSRDLGATARHLGAEIAEHVRLRRAPGLLAGRAPTPTPELADALRRVYAAIASVSGAEVVVDSSKLPTYAALVAGVPGVDLQVLHLVRDPRAAAHSWRRRKHQPDLGASALMERRSAAKSAALWRVWNATLEKWCRDRGVDHRLQNYESFVADPPGETRRILRRFDLLDPVMVDAVVEGMFAGPRVVRLHPNHTVAGNPSRHQHGLVPLAVDDDWRARLGSTDRRTVEVLTWPAARHYGYQAGA